MLPINFMAITAAAVTAFILGFLFHGPLLGRVWMKLADVHPTGKEKFSDMVPQMLKNLLANFVTDWLPGFGNFVCRCLALGVVEVAEDAIHPA